jgi:hypothetical protein
VTIGPEHGVDVHPPSLRAAGDRLRDAADRLDQLWQRHLAASDGRGDVFGTDPVGGLIGGSYRAALGIAGTSFASVSAGLAGFADVLGAMADDFEQTDESNAADLARAGDDVR